MPSAGSRQVGAREIVPPAQPSPDDCRRQLDRILGSRDFEVSDRHRRFLAYVVEESLAGRADRIKAYSVATEVFGRDDTFDPQNDPIVRVEAGHLRRAIDRYYLGAGRLDPVTITIPKGSYAPQFAWGTPASGLDEDAPAPEPLSTGSPDGGLGRLRLAAIALVVLIAAGAAWAFIGGRAASQPDLPRILVEPFQELEDGTGSAAIATGLTQEVVGQIAKFRDIVVVVADARGNPRPPFAGASVPEPRYVLSGAVEIADETLRLQARLVSRDDGAILWADSYLGDLSVSRLLDIERDISEAVATALGQPYGVIFQADVARQVPGTPEDWAAYACTLSYYEYRINLEPSMHPGVRDCLEDAVARFPDYATAWGLLSQVYIDELRFRFAPDPTEGPASVERALAAARRAVALDPMNVRGLQAEMFALYFAGDRDAALKVGRQALAINPNDTELRGEVGYRVALAGDWETGCPLVASARDSNPGPLGYYESALALCAYMRGDLDEAVMWVRKIQTNQNPQYHLIAAAIFGETGDPAGAVEVTWIRQNAPHLSENPRQEIALRVGRDEDIDRFMASLEKAGLRPGG